MIPRKLPSRLYFSRGLGTRIPTSILRPQKWIVILSASASWALYKSRLNGRSTATPPASRRQSSLQPTSSLKSAPPPLSAHSSVATPLRSLGPSQRAVRLRTMHRYDPTAHSSSASAIAGHEHERQGDHSRGGGGDGDPSASGSDSYSHFAQETRDDIDIPGERVCHLCFAF